MASFSFALWGQQGKTDNAISVAVPGFAVRRRHRRTRHCVSAEVSIAPDHLLPARDVEPFGENRVQVANETTLRAARRMVDAGFLGGARAQEVVLCRSSALYSTLTGDPMCRHHCGRSLPDSTEWAILSPDVTTRVSAVPW